MFQTLPLRIIYKLNEVVYLDTFMSTGFLATPQEQKSQTETIKYSLIELMDIN